MNRYILHTKSRARGRLKYLVFGLAAVMAAGAVGYTAHSIGTARAKSRETVSIYTEEELEQYLLDNESEEYNLNGRYRLEEDLELGWLYQSIGTNVEPFTGTFDGNGHVISGLGRPLFGVMRQARVENLFLSEASIETPVTYFDGERYVDGYGALAGYAVNSEIVNCGMGGAIVTDIPMEVMFQTAKAKPEPEEQGPGLMESSGPGTETTEMEAGPGVESSSASTETAEMESAPEGTEGADEPGTLPGESSLQTEVNSSLADETMPPAQSQEHVTGGQEETKETVLEESSSKETDTGEIKPETEEAAGNESKPGVPTEPEAPAKPETPARPEAPTKPETPAKPEVPAKPETPTEPEVPAKPEVPNRPESSTEPEPPSGTDVPSSQETAEPETIAIKARSYQRLTMKTSPIIDVELDNLATPADAESSDSPADEPFREHPSFDIASPSDAERPMEETEGNPYEDTFVQVTAERVTAGGLVAETAEDTVISDCFALVTISSSLETIETYAGGITSILGAGGSLGNSYATGLIDSDDVTGGFVAVNDGLIENSYSAVTVGESGAVRSAFSASGNGSLTGCIYDSQMACVDDIRVENALTEIPVETPAEAVVNQTESSEFGLKASNTINMTGTEIKLPGNWYMTENAYPQITYFALHENEIIAAASKVSAVALILPEGNTLAAVIKEGQIVLPSQVDGEEVRWEAEGNIQINEENHVVTESISISPHNAPNVGSSLVPTEQEEIEPSSGPEKTGAESETDITEPTDSTASTAAGRLKVSIGTAARSFSLTVAAAETVNYTSWAAIGEAVDTDGNDLAYLRPAQDDDGYYLLGTPEAMAWFAYKVNQGNYGYNAKLTDNIDLFGVGYGGRTAADATIDNIDNALLWTPFGDFSTQYTGTFEGNHKYISNLRVSIDNANVSTGFFGTLGNNAKVLNLGIATGKVTGKADGTGGVIGHVRGKNVRIINCWNNASISSVLNLGGIVGSSYASDGLLVEGCYNLGTINNNGGSGSGSGGIYGRSDAHTLTVKNCLNLGRVTALAASRSSGGIQAGANVISKPSVENCLNVGQVTGSKARGAIFGESSSPIKNCYYDNQTSSAGGGTAAGLTTEHAKSWAAAFALNGQSRTQDSDWGIAWNYRPTENNGYPYPVTGILDRPESWLDIGKGIVNGLIKTNTAISGNGSEATPYLISNAEELAFFAAKVNAGETNLHGRLVNDINLTGNRYGGTEENPIPWYPIGTSTNSYKGTFDGNGKVIGYLNVNRNDCAGLFGYAGGGAKITGLGLDSSCHIISTGAADGTAAFVGVVKSDGTAGAQITIQNCYNRASVQGASGNTGAFTGGFDGASGVGTQKISNCYNTGAITSGTGTPGAIAGAFTNGTGGGIQYCYWDSNTSGAVAGVVGSGSPVTVENSGPKTTIQMKSDDASVGILTGLNANLATGTWERTDGKNDGYPIFQKTVGDIDWEVVGAAVMSPAGKNFSSSSTAGTASNPYQLWSAEDLAWFANQVNHVEGKTGLCADVMADISLFGGLYTGFAYDSGDAERLAKALRWIPIGGSSGYTGTFNGNGHTISVMRAEGTDRQGLFGTLGANANIKEVLISDGRIGGGQYCGGIAGYAAGTGVKITSCRNTGELTGTGDYFGGIVGAVGSAGSVVLDGCGSDVSGFVSSPGKSDVGGILGGALADSGTVTVRNCYNRGNVSGGSRVGGIAGSTVLGTQVIEGCYNAGTVIGSGAAETIRSIAGVSVDGSISHCFYDEAKAADARAKGVKNAGFGTWGAAWALNGGKFSQTTGISWTYVEGNAYPSYGTLGGVKNWENVGEAVEYGFLGEIPSGTPYEIQNGEQLAWFARHVNEGGAGGKDAVLTADIDLTGSLYVTAGKLSWVPIGREGAAAYTGTFQSHDESDNWKVFQITGLSIEKESRAGLFGTVSGGTISGIGIENANISGGTAGVAGSVSDISTGGIAGRLENGAVISRCYNRGGSHVSASGSDGVSSVNAGGIAGQITGNSTVKDCYQMESVITASGATGVYAGGITGDASGGMVQNCYHASGAGGAVTVSGTGVAGAAAGKTGATGSIVRCYSDEVLADSALVDALGTADDTERQKQVDALNTETTGSSDVERKRSSRVWFTSLLAEETRGLPTFDAPVMLEVSLNPAESAAGSTVALGQTISGGLYRGVHQENGSSQTCFIKGTAEVVGNYQKYGKTNANQYLGILAGSADLGAKTPSLTEPSVSLGDVSQMTLYNGAAYTCPDSRALLIDFSVGNMRYEVRVEVAGAAEKILSVVLPTSVTIAISPDGTSKTSHSGDIKLVNHNDYPIEGTIRNLNPMTGTGYAVLQPVKKEINLTGKKGQITETGVKLGIGNLRSGTADGTGLTPASVYYTPRDTDTGVEDSWMKYRLKSGGTLWYQYFMEYAADPYYFADKSNYGYTVDYRFGVAEKDYTLDVHAEIIP